MTESSNLDDAAASTGALGRTIWLTGLSGAGKSTIAQALAARLQESDHHVSVLDGDLLRRGLSSDLGLSHADRSEQARRTAHVAALLSQAGVVAIVALVSPYEQDRSMAREIHDERELEFFEVWVDTPVSVCAERDPKGLYARSRAGELHGLTGVDAPYEPPRAAELVVSGCDGTPEEVAERILVAMRGETNAAVAEPEAAASRPAGLHLGDPAGAVGDGADYNAAPPASGPRYRGSPGSQRWRCRSRGSSPGPSAIAPLHWRC